ncbi:isoprenylcysteine carboxylmethyltransferase family protein [Sphingomonas donggukensis]|uniref:methanethiol S-methyltransferase n=1 Tax=Sphingomonas donggukensis TaxID=2949093 RepID=A0ABY4TSS0_9SPHN|nr:methanethiol S-methyltransferase [Sphingomonas donggukensis]URW75363.1 isoprenylcysteine carboxylmethyltransferase family protein [Sphingomonas donggukensis]
MSRPLYLLYAAAAYAVFFATFLYLIAFVGNIPVVPRTVDVGPALPAGSALAIDLGLIALFGIQHSVMARAGFKAWWTRTVPAPIERSTYVLFASIALILLFALWHPIAGTVWAVSGIPAVLVWVVFASGWGIVLLTTFLLDHFELFGLSQVFHHWRGSHAPTPQLRQPLFYKLVRHPLYSGFFLAFWATPVMSVGHLVLALGMSAYMLVAITYEERDLVRLFGQDYEAYRRRVGKLAPRIRRA